MNTPHRVPRGADARDLPSRRGFLQTVAATAAAVVGASAARATPTLDGFGRTPSKRAEDLFSISLAQWSLHRSLGEGKLEHLDFPKAAKQDFGIDAVEYVSRFFAKGGDATYDAALKKRCDDLGVVSLLIMCDGEGRLGDPDPKKRKAAIEAHRKWLDSAKALGCHAIRVNAESEGSYAAQRDLCAEGWRGLCEAADPYGLSVIVENHGGFSSIGAWLAETAKLVDHRRCGTLPDFGNFRVSKDEQYDRYRGMAELMPYARAVSAKSHAFDADGAETGMDYERILRIVVDAGYRGRVGIEYEGSAHSEADGIRLTKALLEKVRAKLAAERASSRPADKK